MSFMKRFRGGGRLWAKVGEIGHRELYAAPFIACSVFLSHPLDDLEKGLGPLVHERLHSLISLRVVIKLVLTRVVTFVECVTRFNEFFELDPRAANTPSNFDPDKHIRAWV